jgi:quercetin dioxygenase-like cupin family protein
MNKTSRLVTAITLTCLLAPAVIAQSIRVSSTEDRTAARGPARVYTGVGIAEILFRAGDDSNLTGAEVTFEPGSRTSWHNHPAGQYLIVTAGIGWIQARGEKKQVIRAGDVVWTPPGVFHWHGGTATQTMSHIAVWEFVDGSGGEFDRLVSDEEYLSEVGTN